MHDEVKCATKISRTEPSGAVFTEYCGRGRHADGCPLAARPSSIVKRGDDLYVNVAGTQIRLTSDPTLGQREIRFEQQVTATRCARCSHAFASAKNAEPLAATSAGMLSEALENEIAAHQERCVIVGDAVEWWPEIGTAPNDPVVQGIVERISDGRVAGLRVRGTAGTWSGSVLPWGMDRPAVASLVDPRVQPGFLRRIPRPQQGDAPHYDTAAALDLGRRMADAAKQLAATPLPEYHAAHIRAMAEKCRQPTPVLYDGLTAEQCLERYEMRQREDVDADVPLGIYPNTLTPDQLAAARALWSAQLKQRVAASAPAERNLVRCDLDDLDGEPG